jgi:hypothetical protein
MSTVALPVPPVVAAPPAPAQPAAPLAARSPWLVGPWFDLLFFANITWPVIALLTAVGVSYGIPEINAGLGFWMMWLLATPHRWITLGLVFLDRERFNQRPSAYTLIFLFFLAMTLSLASQGEKAIALLVIIDFFWNAWHFAAQHSGISRIYARLANPADKSNGMFEKVVLRTFAVYVIVRLAGIPITNLAIWQFWLGWFDVIRPYFVYLDFPMFALPILLLAREIPGLCRASLGRFIYLSSVCLLYSGLLLGVHLDESFGPIEAGLFAAITIFHSTEYLAIVSWSVKKRHAKTKEGVFGYLAPRWGLSLGIFMVALGVGAWAINHHFAFYWALATLFVSYLHYAYDGMIWKVRRPATASVA